VAECRLKRRPADSGGADFKKLNMFYYLYVLKSLKDNNLYIGKTSDLRRRTKEHQSGKVLSTKGRLPLKLIYYEAYLNKNKCTKQELFYKSGIGRDTLKHKV